MADKVTKEDLLKEITSLKKDIQELHALVMTSRCNCNCSHKLPPDIYELPHRRPWEGPWVSTYEYERP